MILNSPREFSRTASYLSDDLVESHGGNIFAEAHHFTVVGGIFTNVTNNYNTIPSVPPDFRIIPMGDIDLRAELHQQLRFNAGSRVVDRLPQRGWFRRVYSAKVEGRTSPMTAAIYEGDGAEKDWRQDIDRYMAVRHPNIMQLYGGASTGRIHATLFHGGLYGLANQIVTQFSFEILFRTKTSWICIGIHTFSPLTSMPMLYVSYRSFADRDFSFDSDSVSGTVLRLELWALNPDAWPSQANYIFHRLGVASHHEDYALLDGVRFSITIPPIFEHSPTGYLFVSPGAAFQCRPALLGWPDLPAYWSFDSSGLDPLSTADAERLGFSRIHLSSEVYVRSWDASVYTALRKFHTAKGFDPTSQDIARHLGPQPPLYKLPSELNRAFIHDNLTDDEGSEGQPGAENGEFVWYAHQPGSLADTRSVPARGPRSFV
ncbi:hypothetical protein B0H16DRAFT_1507669 [Mycena metata]|uniref:Protein kinase domain-containing protein n=1 Tax=Mycena metata TaxID=1033252 RepID=A0AAD7NUI0_9AGAR|nr:hypothetical protein B0H16DRAFT_1507669 [Mycena metata]